MRFWKKIQTLLRMKVPSAGRCDTIKKRQRHAAEKLVPPARFEHAAYGLGNRRSIRLSYGGIGWRITPVGWDDQALG